MSRKENPEVQQEPIDWKSFSRSLEHFVVLAKNHLTPSQLASLRSLSLMAQVEKDRGKAMEFLQQHKTEMRRAVFAQIEKGQIPDALAAELMKVLAENTITAELYAQLGKRYELSGSGQETTDCVRILQQSPTFRAMVKTNETRYFSEGSDLVLSRTVGKVVDVVDQAQFPTLDHYKPTEDKVYIFGLVKPPLYFEGKPNITHLQMPVDVRSDGKLGVIHASSDKRKVVIEPDIQEYLRRSSFVRVYVIEVDLHRPFPQSRFEREPFFGQPRRPHLDVIPYSGMDHLDLIEPQGERIEIDPEEIRVLELMGENRVLEYLTLLTGMREGKLGQRQNIGEALAFRVGVDEKKHSLGLHQITQVVAPLFNRWVGGIDEKTAKAMGKEIYALWQKKQQGKEIPWADLVPFINSYDITDKKYTNVAISTICAYLLIKHLYEDQLLGAYEAYGETFYGLEENPEAIIALGAAYRTNMGVLIRGSQQYRVAEMAHHLGLLNEHFEFTPYAQSLPEFRHYATQVMGTVERDKRDQYMKGFMIDGYRGFQTSFVAYLCYKKLHPSGELTLQDFSKVYDASQRALLSPKSEPAKVMRADYEGVFGKRPRLFLTEDELRGRSRTGLETRSIKFANEGLWVVAHFRKLADENWQRVSKSTSPDNMANPLVERELEERDLRTNEISKIDPEQGRRFRSLIESLPGNPWYRRYPEYLTAACFVNGLFLKEGKHDRDGRWIQEAKSFIRGLFEKNLPEIERRLPPTLQLTEEVRVQLAVASSVMSVDDIVYRLGASEASAKQLLDTHEDRSGIRLRDYSKSFDLLRYRFALKDRAPLAQKEKMNEGEKQEYFVLQVFDAAKMEAEARGYPLDFALVATSMASLECGWGREENEWGEPTLFTGANNLFSIKYDYEQYTEEEYLSQNPLEPYYIHHTKEYFDPIQPQEYTEHYEAFRRYDSLEDSVRDFFDLVERSYPLTMDLVRGTPDVGEPNEEYQEDILQTLFTEKYATDPEYVAKALIVGKRVTKILRQYAQII
jgi:flagellum-specific peptidoglycan hydrolase FlgJ